MKIWRLVLNVVLVILAVGGVVWQESVIDGATILGTTGISIFASLGAALLGELLGIIIGKDDFNKKSYFISAGVGVIIALILSAIVL